MHRRAEAGYSKNCSHNLKTAATKVLYQEGTKIQWPFLWEIQQTRMKNKTQILSTVVFVLILCLSGRARAHFGMIIPSDSMVMQQDGKTVTLTLSFSHPFEGIGMDMVKPKAFGNDEGWGKEIGLKTEIVPLAKPFGLYTGNVFQGIVKIDGAPSPYAEVEVAHYNKDGKAHAPTEYMITQTVKADQNGVFTYAVPTAGWWGFAALSQADFKLKHNGKDKDVEIGAVIWVEFHDWQSK